MTTLVVALVWATSLLLFIAGHLGGLGLGRRRASAEAALLLEDEGLRLILHGKCAEGARLMRLAERVRDLPDAPVPQVTP